MISNKLLRPLTATYPAVRSGSAYSFVQLIDRHHRTRIDKPSFARSSSSQPSVVYEPESRLLQQVKLTKKLSFVSSGVIGLSQPLFYDSYAQMPGLASQIALGGIMTFFFAATPLLIHAFAKKFVTQMTLCPETLTFTATTFTFFLREKRLTFSRGDVAHPPSELSFTTLYAKGAPLLLFPNAFKSRFAYEILMGPDKPVGAEPSKN